MPSMRAGCKAHGLFCKGLLERSDLEHHKFRVPTTTSKQPYLPIWLFRDFHNQPASKPYRIRTSTVFCPSDNSGAQARSNTRCTAVLNGCHDSQDNHLQIELLWRKTRQ